jgi:Dimerisation domain
MDDAGAKVVDLIFGRWRSQILYTGVKLGVFDALASGPKNAISVASALGADAGMLYRLMRADIVADLRLPSVRNRPNILARALPFIKDVLGRLLW